MTEPAKIWQAVLGELEVSLSKANFVTWLKHTTLDRTDGEAALVTVPNGFTKEWLVRHYYDDILAALGKRLPNCKKIDFRISQATAAKPSAVRPATAAPAGASTEPIETEQPLPRGPFNKNSFDNFIIGDSNQLAHAAAVAVANNPGDTYNPLFLYGGAGLGKTHLMQAIGRAVEARTELRVAYVTAEKFTNDFLSSMSRNQLPNFKGRYRKVNVLLVDDVQFLAGKLRVQEEFFHTFNALHDEQNQIVLTSDRPPKAIPTLEDRLRSRFEQSMIADVGPPDLETRIAILRSKARARRYEVDNEVLEFIAKAIQQNIRELGGALIRIMAHAELTGVRPTPRLAEQVLGTILSARHHRKVTIAQIIDAVSRFYDVSIDDLRGPGRQKEIVRPRQMTMFLLREEASLSYPKIGRELGGRDHTTVIHAVGKISDQSQINEPLRHELNLIRERLYA